MSARTTQQIDEHVFQPIGLPALPIAVIEDLVADANDEPVCAEFDESICRRLDKMNDVAGEGWKWALQVSRSSFVGILDRVRTLVLDWAINLERAGVRGSEFDFDTTEKQKAREASMTINIGSIGAFTGNLGSGNDRVTLVRPTSV